MSAETLRRAAAQMRERANVVVFDTGWRVDPKEPQRWLAGSLIIGESSEDTIAAHCASWHPIVALAVADWLDGLAWHVEEFADDDTRDMADALDVARAYLGESA